MTILLLLLLIGCGYSYFLYPLLLRALLRHPPPQGEEPAELPRLSVIITAYNEEERIAAKIEDTLALDYPAERLELMVCSDASDDATDTIVGRYADQGVRLVRATERRGKEHAQLLGIRAAQGEILVFTDVATRIGRDSLLRLVRYFTNPQIGAVSSEDRCLGADGRVQGEGAYVRYEMWLRGLESRAAGLVGLSGSYFAARREICEAEWDIAAPSDFNTAMACARHGLRAISAPDILGYYPSIADERREYARKHRTALRGMTALRRHPDFLSPRRYGLFAFQLFSHKIMRWAVHWFMLATLLLSGAMMAGGSAFATLVFCGELAFLALAALGALTRKLPGSARLPYYFTQVNLALANAAVSLARGQTMVTWQPSRR